MGVASDDSDVNGFIQYMDDGKYNVTVVNNIK